MIELSSASVARRDLIVSLSLLGLVVFFVLAGLAFEGNWRKLLRISIAAVVYVTALLVLLRGPRVHSVPGNGTPFWPFAASMCVAELSSGWLRQGVDADVTFWVAAAAAILIGGTHWLALRAWRPLRSRIGPRRDARMHAVAPRVTD